VLKKNGFDAVQAAFDFEEASIEFGQFPMDFDNLRLLSCLRLGQGSVCLNQGSLGLDQIRHGLF
jgi:hypothetical protein